VVEVTWTIMQMGQRLMSTYVKVLQRNADDICLVKKSSHIHTRRARIPNDLVAVYFLISPEQNNSAVVKSRDFISAGETG